MNRDALAALLREDPRPWDLVGCTATAFLQACRAEDVSALVYHRLRGTPAFASWPQAVRGELERESRCAIAQELLVQRELTRVLDALGARGVRPVLLKGAALAYTVYPHPSLRTRSDTDLMIRQEEAPVVRAALHDLGYAPSLLCDGELLFRQFELARDDEFGISHALDFHWAISTQVAFANVLTFDELAERAVAAPALGSSARVPATVDSLVLALIHPAMHHQNDQRLLWRYDVHLLAGRLNRSSAEELIWLARAKRVAAVCADGLRTARAWFGTEVPDALLVRLAAVPITQQPTAAYLAPERSWAVDASANLHGLPRWRDRLRLIREIAFPSPAYMWRSYRVPEGGLRRALLPALYLHRGVRGVWRVMSGRK